MNLIIAALASVAILSFIFTGVQTKAASEAPKQAALGGWSLVENELPSPTSRRKGFLLCRRAA